MKKLITNLSGLLLVVLMSVSFASCSSDDDADDTTEYDFSIVWSVADKGDFTTSQANQMAENFNEITENVFEECTTSKAKGYFSEFMNDLRDELDDLGANISFKATLYNEDTEKDVTSKTIVCTPEGAYLK